MTVAVRQNKMDFQTPKWVCEIMVNQIEGNPKRILEPTPGEGNLIEVITRRYPKAKVVRPSNNFFDLGIERVDYVIANPPFTPTAIGYEMLERMFLFSDDVIVLMPWVALINGEERTKRYLNQGLKKVIHLPRRAFMGARVQTCIMIFEKEYQGEITLGFIR